MTQEALNLQTKATLKPTIEHDRFIQSRNMKEAQQFLWEASLSHNCDEVIHLKMAILHLQQELHIRRQFQILRDAADKLEVAAAKPEG